MRLKRVISAALAVSMAVSMMPATAVSAFAEGTSTKTAETTTVTGKNTPKAKQKPLVIVVQRIRKRVFSGLSIRKPAF